MSEVRTFFRYCPSCGKRFHIRLVGKKLVDEQREKEDVKEAVPVAPVYGMSPMGGYGIPLVVEQDTPVTVEVEKFSYTYKCKHCGHVWSEMHTEISRE